MEGLSKIRSGRLHVGQQWNVITMLLPILQRQFDTPGVPGNRNQVDRRMVEPPSAELTFDRINEGRALQDPRRRTSSCANSTMRTPVR